MSEPKDLQIDTHLVQADLEADPEMAKYVRDFSAKMRQAYAAVQSGQHRTMDEALRELGIEMVKYDPVTGEEIEDASFHQDMGLDFDALGLDIDREFVVVKAGKIEKDDEDPGDA